MFAEPAVHETWEVSGPWQGTAAKGAGGPEPGCQASTPAWTFAESPPEASVLSSVRGEAIED